MTLPTDARILSQCVSTTAVAAHHRKTQKPSGKTGKLWQHQGGQRPKSKVWPRPLRRVFSSWRGRKFLWAPALGKKIRPAFGRQASRVRSLTAAAARHFLADRVENPGVPTPGKMPGGGAFWLTGQKGLGAPAAQGERALLLLPSSPYRFRLAGGKSPPGGKRSDLLNGSRRPATRWHSYFLFWLRRSKPRSVVGLGVEASRRTFQILPASLP